MIQKQKEKYWELNFANGQLNWMKRDSVSDEYAKISLYIFFSDTVFWTELNGSLSVLRMKFVR